MYNMELIFFVLPQGHDNMAYMLPCFTAENAAVCIQRMWRGYHTRNLNRRVTEAYHDIQASRMQEYIQ
jgi:hypothetical protein